MMGVGAIVEGLVEEGVEWVEAWGGEGGEGRRATEVGFVVQMGHGVIKFRKKWVEAGGEEVGEVVEGSPLSRLLRGFDALLSAMARSVGKLCMLAHLGPSPVTRKALALVSDILTHPPLWPLAAAPACEHLQPLVRRVVRFLGAPGVDAWWTRVTSERYCEFVGGDGGNAYEADDVDRAWGVVDAGEGVVGMEREVVRAVVGVVLEVLGGMVGGGGGEVLQEARDLDACFEGLEMSDELILRSYDLHADNDDLLIAFMLKCLRLHQRIVTQEAASQALQLPHLARILGPAYSPHRHLLWFLAVTSYDADFVMDLLIGNETRFLEYLMAYLKHAFGGGEEGPDAERRRREFVEGVKWVVRVSGGRRGEEEDDEDDDIYEDDEDGENSENDQGDSALAADPGPVLEALLRKSAASADTPDDACEMVASVETLFEELEQRISTLHARKLFPYNPGALLRRLREACGVLEATRNEM
ncbi:hypothetical protein HDU96_006542 [Phlyctochytrium bullatum]|nr:hypothetical protein HDU96_006542 [Phlyctochytrium bullatum]